MDVQPQAVTVRKGQLLIVFVFKRKGFVERVSHIRVSSVIICMQLLNIFQIRFQHVQDDPGLSLEDQGVFCHKEIAALAAQVRDRDAAAAGGESPRFP